jgi:hypothetical protein
MEGMTGRMTRHFYNNVMTFSGKATNYLEIGAWKGSSLISAMHGNESHVTATVIDNWSQFGGPSTEFKANVDALLSPSHKLTVLDQDCYTVNVSKLPPIDVYMFDGDHAYQAQYKAMKHFAPCLAESAIVLIDDWNWSSVRNGTADGLNAVKHFLQVVYADEVRHTNDNTHSTSKVASAEFWNGIGIFVVERRAMPHSVAKIL